MGTLRLLVELAEDDALNAFMDSDEDALLREAVAAGGVEGWAHVVNRLEAGAWRLAFPSRAWLSGAVDIEVVKAWVATSVERARIIAEVTSLGGDTFSPVARFLLDHFGSDKRVASTLMGELISGFWSGNESDRIKGQIQQVTRWLEQPRQSRAVKKWARTQLRWLRIRLDETLQQEAEEDW